MAIVGKSWPLHVEQIMANSLEENLAMIRDSVALLKTYGREVIYDAEHFFDGFKDNTSYALQTVAAAAENGADTVVLCDTNGGTLPSDIQSTVEAVRRFLDEQRLRVRIGIHTHNDCGVAVARCPLQPCRPAPPWCRGLSTDTASAAETRI